MRSRPPPRDFGSGELDPRLDGIANEVTQRGARTLENWIVRKTGSAIRRPGTRFVREVKDSADETILVPVEIDTTNSFVLELGDAYMRFFQQSSHSVIGAPYEVATPWSTADLSDLRWQYIPDEKAVYWTHPAYAMRKLAFTSAASWTLGIDPIISGNGIGIFGSYGRGVFSIDGEDWKDIVLPTTGDGPALRGAWLDGTWIVVGTNESYLSDDAISWVSTFPTIPNTPANSGYNVRAGSSKMVLINDESTAVSGCLWVSYDLGTTWVEKSAPATGTFFAIGYNPVEYGWRIGGVAKSGYSINAHTWTSVALAGSVIMTDIYSSGAVDNSTTLWVASAYGNPGLTGTIYTATSVTGAWTQRTTPTGTTRLYGLTYGLPGGSGLWVAHGGSVAGAEIITSANGTSWTRRSPPSGLTAAIQSMIWTGHQFMAVGGFPYVLKSDDGITWTKQSSDVFVGIGDGATSYFTQIVVAKPKDSESFDATDHYPADVTFHEQRIIIGPTNNEPSSVWGSRTGKPNVFYIGDLANEAWTYKLSGDRNVDIKWIMGGTELVVGTRTEEIVLRGQPGLGITPNGVQALKQSTFGSANVKPVRIHDTIVFVQRGGEVIRGYVPQAGTGAWQSPDLTYHAGHITEGGVTQLAHQDDPQAILYAIRGDGTLLALTYHPPNVVAWTRIVTDGDFESIAVVPTSGAEDEVWAIVKRTIGGSTKRYVEYFSTLNPASQTSAHYLDSGVSVTAGATFATMGSLTHLAGKLVDVLIDGNEWLSGLTVAASGTIAFTTGYSGTTAHAGLPYTSKLQTMRSDYGSPNGSGAGLNRRTSNTLLWVHDSLGGFMGPTYTLATEAVLALSSTALLTTDIVPVNFPGQFDRDNYLWLVVTQPTPFEVVGLLADSESGDR